MSPCPIQSCARTENWVHHCTGERGGEGEGEGKGTGVKIGMLFQNRVILEEICLGFLSEIAGYSSCMLYWAFRSLIYPISLNSWLGSFICLLFLLRYFKVLIQEMDVKVDMSFVMALLGLTSFDTNDRSQEVRICSAGFIKIANAFTASGCVSPEVR